jgi:hypothetical protein
LIVTTTVDVGAAVYAVDDSATADALDVPAEDEPVGSPPLGLTATSPQAERVAVSKNMLRIRPDVPKPALKLIVSVSPEFVLSARSGNRAQ